MSHEFSPLNRIGHFYDTSIEEPSAVSREISEGWIGFPVSLEEADEGTEELPLADTSVPWQRLLAITTQEALDRSATSVEFLPRLNDVVVPYVAGGGHDEAGTLSRGVYEAFLRYLRRVADGSRIEIPLINRSIGVKIESRESEHGQQIVLHLPEEQPV